MLLAPHMIIYLVPHLRTHFFVCIIPRTWRVTLPFSPRSAKAAFFKQILFAELYRVVLPFFLHNQNFIYLFLINCFLIILYTHIILRKVVSSVQFNNKEINYNNHLVYWTPITVCFYKYHLFPAFVFHDPLFLPSI